MPVGSREERLNRTFVVLSDALATGFDVIGLAHLLVESCAEWTTEAEIALALRSPRGDLRVLAARHGQRRLTGLVEHGGDDDPWHECLRTGRPVTHRLPDGDDRRRPEFSARARSAGFAVVYAFPLRPRGMTIGVLALAGDRTEILAAEDEGVVRAIADTASVGIIEARAAISSVDVANAVQHVLHVHAVLDQATAMVAETRQIDMDRALAMIVEHARRRQVPVTTVAGDIANRLISAASFPGPSN
ncbi:MAG: GAF domain-containing protein [Acidimicrobiales bacterium]